MKPSNLFKHIVIFVKTFIFKCLDLARKYSELIRYVIFGVLTTIVDFGVYTLLYELAKINGTLANAAAWFAAVIFAFITNKLFVFASKSMRFTKVLYEFGTFFAARAVTGAVYIGGYALLTKIGLNGYIAKIFLSVFNIIVNYIFSKLVTFRKKKPADSISDENEIKNTPSVINGSIMIGNVNENEDGNLCSPSSEKETNAVSDKEKCENKDNN